jgi:hypothetical protein
VPYAFKAYALEDLRKEGADLVIWADACIVPIRSMEPLWEKIERDGYWFMRNGYTNYEWTADSAYPDLFPELVRGSLAREVNKTIPHVVATSFGLNLQSEIGKAFLDEYYRLASTTRALCGPWQNSNAPNVAGRNTDRWSAPCGPPDVSGHRHDQTAASVIAWRLGMKLTEWPEFFSYAKYRDDGSFHLADQDEKTILCAAGAYHVCLTS